jgi:hypothetical protein
VKGRTSHATKCKVPRDLDEENISQSKPAQRQAIRVPRLRAILSLWNSSVRLYVDDKRGTSILLTCISSACSSYTTIDFPRGLSQLSIRKLILGQSGERIEVTEIFANRQKEISSPTSRPGRYELYCTLVTRLEVRAKYDREGYA